MSDMTPEKAQALLDGATPGPWLANGEPWNLIVWSSTDNRICFMAHSNGLDEDRDVATAELVAAAPDLARAYIAQAAELTRLRAMNDIVEHVARAWAVMDGKADRFDACKTDRAIEAVEGRYLGYRADAEGLLEISGLAAEMTRLRAQVGAADKLAEAGRDARETILHFVHARWSEAEGSDEDYVGELTAALSAYEEAAK